MACFTTGLIADAHEHVAGSVSIFVVLSIYGKRSKSIFSLLIDVHLTSSQV